jgi:hypothetical protein
MSANDENARKNRETIVRIGADLEGVLANVASAALDSIQNGSALTGSPGQPVRSGFLKGSWQLTFPSRSRAIIGTNCEYAEAIEDGVGKFGPLTLRAHVGGWHSAKLTAANADRIVDAEVAKVKGRA